MKCVTRVDIALCVIGPGVVPLKERVISDIERKVTIKTRKYDCGN